MSTTTVSMTEAKNTLADVVNRVAYGGERIILASRGRPKAALISIDDLRALEVLQDVETRKARMSAWLDKARDLRQQILKRREGIPLPDSTQLLHELHQERTDAILGLR